MICPVQDKAARHGSCHCTRWWGAEIPRYLWACLWTVTLPLRAAVWLLEAAVATVMVGMVLVLWAWWTERITDEQVAQFFGRIGERGLTILSNSGLL